MAETKLIPLPEKDIAAVLACLRMAMDDLDEKIWAECDCGRDVECNSEVSRALIQTAQRILWIHVRDPNVCEQVRR